MQTTSVPGHRCPPGATKQLELQNDWYQRGSGGWPDHTSGASMGPVVLGSASRDLDGWNDSLNTPCESRIKASVRPVRLRYAYAYLTTWLRGIEPSSDQ